MRDLTLSEEIAGARAWFVDTTLRDGEQSAGLNLSPVERCQIARKLWETGVRELEVGIPASGDEAVSRINRVRDAVPEAWLLAWCRARREDIIAARSCAVDGVNLSFPLSDCHLRIWGKSRQWVLRTLAELSEEAAAHFSYIAIGGQDASRADPVFLSEFCHAVAELPVLRLRLADTVGILTPDRTAHMVRLATRALRGKSIEIHAHNDLGMATANTIAAWQAGAKCLSTTINGVGERAGNAAFEEVVMGLHAALGVDAGIRRQELVPLCRMLETFAHRSVPPTKPVSGREIHVHESGLHILGLHREALSYQAYSAEETGCAETFLIGPQTGPRAVARVLCLEDTEAARVYPALCAAASLLGRALTVGEALSFLAASDSGQAASTALCK